MLTKFKCSPFIEDLKSFIGLIKLARENIIIYQIKYNLKLRFAK